MNSLSLIILKTYYQFHNGTNLSSRKEVNEGLAYYIW
jgi:hypothetical protein